MKKQLLATALVALLAGAVGCASDDGVDGVVVEVEATFETSAGDWVIVGDAEAVSEATFSDGSIAADDYTTGGVWFFSAPSAVVERLAVDRRLSFQLRVDSVPGYPFDFADVAVFSGDEVIYHSFGGTPTEDWTDYSLDLGAAEWFVGETDGVTIEYAPNDARAESELVARLLNDADRLWIRGEYNVGPDVGYLDNVIITSGQAE